MYIRIVGPFVVAIYAVVPSRLVGCGSVPTTMTRSVTMDSDGDGFSDWRSSFDSFFRRPVLGSTHINPVAMELDTDLLVTMRNEEGLQRAGYRKIKSAVHLLKRLLKLNGALCPDLALDCGRHDLVKTDFVLESGADGIGRYVQNLVPRPHDTAALTLRQKVTIRAKGRTRQQGTAGDKTGAVLV